MEILLTGVRYSPLVVKFPNHAEEVGAWAGGNDHARNFVPQIRFWSKRRMFLEEEWNSRVHLENLVISTNKFCILRTIRKRQIPSINQKAGISKWKCEFERIQWNSLDFHRRHSKFRYSWLERKRFQALRDEWFAQGSGGHFHSYLEFSKITYRRKKIPSRIEYIALRVKISQE